MPARDALAHGIAAAPALGFTGDDFTRAYAANRTRSVTNALDASPIYLPLHAMLKDKNGIWTGTTKDLLNRLIGECGLRPPSDMPKSPKALACQLDRLIPNLRADGITVKRLGRDPVKRIQILKISKVLSATEQTEIEAKRKCIADSIAAEKQRREDDRRQRLMSSLNNCQIFLKNVLAGGPITRRNIRRMAQGQMPMPSGATSQIHYGNDLLDRTAGSLNVIVKGNKAGLWWSLPEAAGTAAGQD